MKLLTMVWRWFTQALRRERETVWPVPNCPHCGGPARWVHSESVGPVYVYEGVLQEVIPERVYFLAKPCGHKTYRDDDGQWVLCECAQSDWGRHLWRDDRRLVVPVEEYCAECGERRAIVKK